MQGQQVYGSWRQNIEQTYATRILLDLGASEIHYGVADSGFVKVAFDPFEDASKHRSDI